MLSLQNDGRTTIHTYILEQRGEPEQRKNCSKMSLLMARDQSSGCKHLITCFVHHTVLCIINGREDLWDEYCRLRKEVKELVSVRNKYKR